jgi:hypothetical protein
MRNRIPASFALVSLLAAGVAHADEPAAAIAAAPSRANSATAQIDILPSGTLTLGDRDVDTDSAYGIGFTVDRDVVPGISIGIAPRLILGVTGEGGTDSATQYDLRLRARAHTAFDTATRGYAFIAPGWSIIDIPDTDETSTGLVVALGVGVTRDVSPTMFVGGELGYQLGKQEVNIGGEDVEVSTSFLHVGVILGTYY